MNESELAGDRPRSRPAGVTGVHFPSACRADRLVVNVRVPAVQRSENLLLESANEAHAEHGGVPVLTSASRERTPRVGSP